MEKKKAAHPENAAADDFWTDFELRLDTFLEEVIALAPMRILALWLAYGRLWTNSFFTSW